MTNGIIKKFCLVLNYFMDLTLQYKITDYMLSITTDNASNNGTLMEIKLNYQRPDHSHYKQGSKNVTFHVIFSIYNKLFDHLEASIRQLQWKKVAWKNLMLSALYAAKKKLSIYYGETDKVYGDLFVIRIILTPQNKL
ncbi:hypothetical protein GB937_010598 [Aspergillus fischeri]|nr:hypothetical protein GB937_010598 [Aspergillus fischeri]